MSNYFLMYDAGQAKTYAFKVLQSGYKPTYTKTQKEQNTVTGSLDVQVGPTNRSWDYTVKAYGEATGSFAITPITGTAPTTAYWGSSVDLLRLFSYSAAPNNTIPFRDLDGTEHTILFSGNVSPKPRTSFVSGASAYFEIQVVFKEIV